MSSVANKYRHLYTLYTSEFHISEMRAALAKIDVLDKDSEAGKRQQIVSGSHKRAGTPYAVDIQRDTEGLDQKTLIQIVLDKEIILFCCWRTLFVMFNTPLYLQ